MNKVFQIILGIAVLLIMSVATILHFKDQGNKREKNLKDLQNARTAKKAKETAKAIENENEIINKNQNGEKSKINLDKATDG